jgi:DUF971 family protein
MREESAVPGQLPIRIERVADGIAIHWNDGTVRRYTPRGLRDACPCAGCREKRDAAAPSPLQVLAPQELAPLEIRGMQPVGQYAYSIDFSDGHDTGIYTLELLRGLGG